MSKSIVPFIPPTASASQVESFTRDFLKLEQAHERNRILAQGLQGMCLAELQDAYGFGQGGDRKTGIKTAQCGFDSWEKYLDKTFGISTDTASRRMKCWVAIHARLKKLSGPDAKAVAGLLGKPMSKITPKEWNLLQAVTHKVTDAASQAELLAEAKYLIQEHGAGLGKGKGKKTKPEPADDDGEKEDAIPDPKLLIKDEIHGPILRMSEHWHSPLDIGAKEKIPLWQHMTKAELRKAVETLEEMIEPAKEALNRK